MLPRTTLALALLAALSLTAAACGLKGPLYRPDEAKSESVTPANPAPGTAETTRKKDTSGSSVPGAPPDPSVAPPDPDRPDVPPPGR
jgi:predicted small lipoprotein YifL